MLKWKSFLLWKETIHWRYNSPLDIFTISADLRWTCGCLALCISLGSICDPGCQLAGVLFIALLTQITGLKHPSPLSGVPCFTHPFVLLRSLILHFTKSPLPLANLSQLEVSFDSAWGYRRIYNHNNKRELKVVDIYLSMCLFLYCKSIVNSYTVNHIVLYGYLDKWSVFFRSVPPPLRSLFQLSTPFTCIKRDN